MKQLAAMVLTALLVLVLGCQKKDEAPLEHVTIRLKWMANASFAGELWAKENGLFKAMGLDVAIKEGGPGHDVIKDLELGRIQFGIASADQILRAVDKGVRLRVLAQIFQKNPLRWIYFADRIPTPTPETMKGLTVGITYGGNDETIFTAFMKKWGMSQADLRLYGVHYDFHPFWLHQVDLWPVYWNTQGVTLSQKMKAQGEEAGFFDPSKWGINLVANCLVTSERYYSTHPEVVRAFSTAALKGWKMVSSKGNLDQGVKLLAKYNPETPPSLLARQLQATATLIAVPEGSIGWIDTRAWEETVEIMLTQGLIGSPPDLKRLLAGPPP